MYDTAPANLRPYGTGLTAGLPTSAGDMQPAVLQRAAAKYSALRAGRFVPAGADVRRTLLAAALAIAPAALLGLIAAAVTPENTIVGAFFGALALLMASIPLIIFVASRPSSPKAALTNYLRALARGRHRRARQLVLDADLDDFPRVQPVLHGLGQPSGMAAPFSSEAAFRAYWDGLLRWRPPCYCFVALRKVNVREIAPDLALVEAEVKFTMNSSLWALLILVALPIAVIVDIATRTRVRVPLRKVLVRAGNEWRIFNAELMGVDEHDLSWLTPNA